MQLRHSSEFDSRAPLERVAAVLNAISEPQLKEWVRKIAVPRHFLLESKQNRATAAWLREQFALQGYVVLDQGEHSNILAKPRDLAGEAILIGAHYDTVPGSPGADDNGSAVAAMLGCAAACSRQRVPVVFVAFNREEEHLTGSRDFVGHYLLAAEFRVRCAHILEMVGFASAKPGSQKLPTALPIQLPDRGDFLGLLANDSSAQFMDSALVEARTYLPSFPVIGLKVQPGVERVFPVLARSDHVPFWETQRPAVMWTDTAEFRNPHYHQSSDTPDTLDYGFLLEVTQLLTAVVLAQAGGITTR